MLVLFELAQQHFSHLPPVQALPVQSKNHCSYESFDLHFKLMPGKSSNLQIKPKKFSG